MAALRFEERAATAIDPRMREHWKSGRCLELRHRLRLRERKAIDAVRPSSPSRAPGRSTRGVGGDAGFATRQESREFGLCHCASGKGSEYWRVTCAAVR